MTKKGKDKAVSAARMELRGLLQQMEAEETRLHTAGLSVHAVDIAITRASNALKILETLS